MTTEITMTIDTNSLKNNRDGCEELTPKYLLNIDRARCDAAHRLKLGGRAWTVPFAQLRLGTTQTGTMCGRRADFCRWRRINGPLHLRLDRHGYLLQARPVDWLGGRDGIFLGMLVTALLARRAARSEVGRLLYSERQRLLNYLLIGLAFASWSAGVLVLTRLGFRHGRLSPSAAIVVMVLLAARRKREIVKIESGVLH